MRGLSPEEIQQILEELSVQRRENPVDWEKKFSSKPPWAAFPDLHRYSMGWRMGGGEDYISGFRTWFAALPADRKAQYRADHSEPEEWAGFYDQIESRNGPVGS